ncbi:hypothetical protein Btru_055622 [Bulinus truncatus]|nr:hypothetical protein Btru_055622 [Bulinus truncatus]
MDWMTLWFTEQNVFRGICGGQVFTLFLSSRDFQQPECFCTNEESTCTIVHAGSTEPTVDNQHTHPEQINILCDKKGGDMISCKRPYCPSSPCDRYLCSNFSYSGCSFMISLSGNDRQTMQCLLFSDGKCQCDAGAFNPSTYAPGSNPILSYSSAVDYPNEDGTSSNTIIGVAVGVSIGLTMIIVALVVLILWRRRQQRSLEKPVIPLPKSYLLNDDKLSPQKQFSNGGFRDIVSVELPGVDAVHDDVGDGLTYEIVTEALSHKPPGQPPHWATSHDNTTDGNIINNTTHCKNIHKNGDANIKKTPKRNKKDSRGTNISGSPDTTVGLNRQVKDNLITHRVSLSPDNERVYEDISPTDSESSSSGHESESKTIHPWKTNPGANIATSPSLYNNFPNGLIQNNLPDLSDVGSRQDSIYFELEKNASDYDDNEEPDGDTKESDYDTKKSDYENKDSDDYKESDSSNKVSDYDNKDSDDYKESDSNNKESFDISEDNDYHLYSNV